MESVLIAYSGGTDSTFLLKIAREELRNKVFAVTINSEIYFRKEITDAKKMTEKLGIKHLIVENSILTNKEFISNPPDRCYICKRELFSKINGIAQEYNLNYVIDGSNHDDISDYRPGMRAVKELKIRSPLQEALLTKNDIRLISKEMNLPTWDKPSNSCLATRIPYGEKITLKKLKKIDCAEEFIRNLGINQIRVRLHNNLARIEVKDEDLVNLLKEDLRNKIVTRFRQLGFIYITIDLQGYRTGSMNEILKEKIED